MGRDTRLTRRTALRTGAVAAGTVGLGLRPVTARSEGACTYQVDFVAGEPNEVLGETDDDFYGVQGRLIQYLHGDADGAVRRDGWLNSLDPATCAAVDDDPIRLSGETASVEFRVAEGSERTLSLVVYTLPGGTFSFDTADEQDLVDAATGTFGPGTHSIEASLPCAVSTAVRVVGDDVAPGSGFGRSVALDGPTLFVGAPEFDDGVGAAYAFADGDGGWEQSDRFVGPTRPVEYVGFGAAVAVDGDAAFVSAPGYPTGELQAHGAVFVYGREPDGWAHRRTFVLDYGNVNGGTVDLDGTRGIAVGEGVFVWVFERSGGAWEQVDRLSAEVVDEYAATTGALSDDTVVAGSYTRLEAYVFERSDAGWGLTETITPPEGLGHSESLFGISVDVDGDTVAVGDPKKTDDPGAVFVYERSADGWERATDLTVDGSGVGDSFALRGDRLLVDAGGVTHLFERSDGTWTRERTVDYGGVLAFDGTRAAFGAPGGDDERGAVHVVDL